MKTKKQVIADYPEYKTLINGVISRIGMSSVMDVVNHGIDGGFSGFIYHSETHRFAMRHRKQIISLLSDQYHEFGYSSIVEMVAGFGVFRQSPMGEDATKDLYRYLGGGRPGPGTITNVMAWYAAEEVCRWFDE